MVGGGVGGAPQKRKPLFTTELSERKENESGEATVMSPGPLVPQNFVFRPREVTGEGGWVWG